VLLWRTSDWQLAGRVVDSAHTLTVTRIRFSPDDTLLLTVGRDRTWQLAQRGAFGLCTNHVCTYVYRHIHIVHGERQTFMSYAHHLGRLLVVQHRVCHGWPR
jgi:hypothetical protein